MRYCIIVLMCIFLGGLVPELAAAQSMLDVDVTEYKVGDLVGIKLGIDTEIVSVNTIESKLSFSPSILEFVSSDDRDSVVDLWIEKPKLFDDTRVHFAGLTPLGFTSHQATVVTLFFRVKQSVVTQVALQNPLVLRNDGLGTALDIKAQTFTLSAVKPLPTEQVPQTDTELPEDFTPSIVSDPDAFGGQSTVLFSTRDSGSGISHYEVKEGYYGKYVRADSPYILRFQSLDRPLYIKAVDRAGNERIEILYPQNWKPGYEPIEIIVTIVVLCFLFVCIGVWRYLHRRR